MSQIFTSAAAVSALIAGAIAFTGNSSETNPVSTHQDFSFLQEIPAATEWVFTNQQDNSVCIVSKTQRITVSTSTIEADATCGDIFRDMDLVSVWQQDENGYLTLADEHGIAIAEFSWEKDSGFVSISGEPGKYALTPSS